MWLSGTRKRELDYYGILGISKGATAEEIKSAYRRLSKQYSAEKQEDKELGQLFSLISEAYEVLVTPLFRAIYDQYGEEGLKKGVFTPYGWHPPYCYHGDPTVTYKKFYGSDSPYADLLDVLRNPPTFFEYSGGKAEKKKTPSLTKELALTLEEMYNGCLKTTKIQRRVFADEDKVVTKVKEELLTISVKPGTPVGTQKTFTGVGDEGHGVIPGDIIFVVEEKPHPVFARDGLNLYMRANVTLVEALTGIILTIKTLDDRIIRAAITQIITPYYQKIIVGEGMPAVEKPAIKGNLIVTFDIDFPSYLPLNSRKMMGKAMTEALPEGTITSLAVAEEVKDKIAREYSIENKDDEDITQLLEAKAIKQADDVSE